MLSEGEGKPLREVSVGDVGVVFQRYPLFDDLNVLNNLVVPALRAGMPKKEARDKALRLLDDFDMVKQGLAWPLQLSGGQRQRVAILQQLMQDRHFIILDEPFSGLDPVNITTVIELIARTANQHSPQHLRHRHARRDLGAHRLGHGLPPRARARREGEPRCRARA